MKINSDDSIELMGTRVKNMFCFTLVFAVLQEREDMVRLSNHIVAVISPWLPH